MMTFRACRAALCAFGLAFAQPLFAHGMHGGTAQLEKYNNDRSIAIQVYGGTQKDSGKVKLSYYGNMAVLIESPKGVKVFVDPWRNDIVGMYPPWYMRDMPIVRTDIALVTHAHFDHDAIERVQADQVLDRMAGEFSFGDVKITGIADKHVCETQGDIPYRKLVKFFIDQDPCPPNEGLQWDNSLYVIETGGLRILHWGDNRQNPPERVWQKIGHVDVAILAVSDEGHILSQKWADVVMEKSGAHIVIPSHYYIKGVHIPGALGLESADKWVAKHENTRLTSGVLELTPAMVAKYQQHVMYFGDNVAFETTVKLPADDGKLPEVPPPETGFERFNPDRQ
ncbi:MAG: MBL fold metallo-hydrolase [Gammaproteobacteria bacterium]|nr:MBL fold metallo-hydrolase [Gammaproteobacteria bacterium]